MKKFLKHPTTKPKAKGKSECHARMSLAECEATLKSKASSKVISKAKQAAIADLKKLMIKSKAKLNAM